MSSVMLSSFGNEPGTDTPGVEAEEVGICEVEYELFVVVVMGWAPAPVVLKSEPTPPSTEVGCCSRALVVSWAHSSAGVETTLTFTVGADMIVIVMMEVTSHGLPIY